MERTTQKQMVRRHNKEGGDHPEQKSDKGQWKAVVEDCSLQSLDTAQVKVKGEKMR